MIYNPLENTNEEEYDDRMELNVSVTCPYCAAQDQINVFDYEEDSYVYDTGENRMGERIEHYVECDDYACSECGKTYSFSGTIWEYPIGALENDNDIRCQPH